MAHTHNTYDEAPRFSIDPVTRIIKNESGMVVLIQGDHKVKRFTFEIPRFVGGHDMSLCSRVQVHYINIASKTGKKSIGVYECDDLQISSASEDIVICSWLIYRNATRYSGPLNFALRFACLTGEVIDYDWSTAIHSGIRVSDGINNGEAVVTQFPDVLEAWKREAINYVLAEIPNGDEVAY